MVAAHLFVNAALYVVLAGWCTLSPRGTSESIGFEFAKNSARSEYIVIYGGLELGLALFYLFTALDSSMWKAGILFSLCLYGCLAVYRIGTIVFMRDLGTFPYAMAVIEVSMAAWALFAWTRLS